MTPNYVHCLFEQSGTFKNEFIKLGIPAADYDIQNNFGETDHVVDLFAEIEKAYQGGISMFDNIGSDDLVLAFFPCIYFSCLSQIAMTWNARNYKNKTTKEASDLILERAENRLKFYSLAVKLITIAKVRKINFIMENPWSMQTYLKANFVTPPTIIDRDRAERGDYFHKETAYWFVNFEPTKNTTYQINKNTKKISSCKPGIHAGLCSEERSTISTDYARNFICDFILGKPQHNTQLNLTASHRQRFTMRWWTMCSRNTTCRKKRQ